VSEFPAVQHVAVTVTDLEASAQWYERLFEAKPVLDEDAGGFYHKVYALGGGTLFGLHSHPTTDASDNYTEFRPGLDHVSFGVGDRSELERWETRLDDLGIAHGGIVDAHYGSGLSFRDPDNIALEIFAPPS
jgi:catechol 2,3-dioxygenase-like lactoylglutathione lyase family enzyme